MEAVNSLAMGNLVWVWFLLQWCCFGHYTSVPENNFSDIMGNEDSGDANAELLSLPTISNKREKLKKR